MAALISAAASAVDSASGLLLLLLYWLSSDAGGLVSSRTRKLIYPVSALRACNLLAASPTRLQAPCGSAAMSMCRLWSASAEAGARGCQVSTEAVLDEFLVRLERRHG